MTQTRDDVRPGRRRRRAQGPATVVAALFFALLVALLVLGRLPALLLAVYGLLSGVAVAMYRADKSAATAGRRRTRESSLHTVDVLGGWPGGLVARHLFRHKTLKQPFRTVYWCTVIVNCAALAWFVTAAPAFRT
jgi:uncharacterized membrane protein YsdA (DUF1294 family)